MTQPQEDDFSEHYLELAFCTTLRKRPENYDGYGRKGRECGDALEVFLNVQDGLITKVHYYSIGCYATNACGNALAELACGKSISQAQEISPADLVAFLETLPPHEFHCAEMAIAALQLALTDFENR